MNILLIFPVFIIAFIIVLLYKRKIKLLKKELENKAHFYVARDKDGKLFLYFGKPIRISDSCFFPQGKHGKIITSEIFFYNLNLNPKDYDSLKWEDDPIEVFKYSN